MLPTQLLQPLLSLQLLKPKKSPFDEKEKEKEEEWQRACDSIIFEHLGFALFEYSSTSCYLKKN